MTASKWRRTGTFVLAFCAVLITCLLVMAAISRAQAVHSTVFTWTASSSTGISPTTGLPTPATYNAYKQAGCTGTFVKLNTAPIVAATFTDTGMADGELNCYLFTASVTSSSGVVSESAQSQSETVRIVTPTSPTITPGTAAVTPPTKPVGKPT